MDNKYWLMISTMCFSIAEGLLVGLIMTFILSTINLSEQLFTIKFLYLIILLEVFMLYILYITDSYLSKSLRTYEIYKLEVESWKKNLKTIE